MDMNTILGSLISGFAVRLYAAGIALYVGNEAATFISDTFAKVQLPL